MSFTSDGMVHFYAREGVEDLEEEDFLMSSYPYGYRHAYFDNIFFNVANWENGRTWSTPWVVDDPEVFVKPPTGRTLADLTRRRRQGSSAVRQASGRMPKRQGKRGYKLRLPFFQ